LCINSKKSELYRGKITMSWIVHILIGVIIGIMFSVAYPDLAMSVNNSIEPMIRSIGEQGLEIFNDTVINFISTNVSRS